ncbi:MAG: radical SAM family heme chaperone HemW [Deltaproteobacteria bacterium]|nr:radical SAM family heme chaperone HemW [Deltaproteobacteria bacterium]
MGTAERKNFHRQTPIGNRKIAGLYIHIPFCRTKCPYCTFYSETNLSFISDYLKALFQEMEMARDQFNQLETVYIGGGTPSVLLPHQIQAILERIRQNFQLVPDAEITLEANPADLSTAYLQSLRASGVNRLNVGVQSFDSKILNFLGRRHSLDQAISSILTSREAGFDNLGMDLIYGVPGQEMESWLATLARAVNFAPEHISCYQLTVEAGTPFSSRQQKGEWSLPPEDLQYNFFMKTSARLEEAGYIHYEVSNFARGMEYASRHNQKYWNHTPYLGLGPSAHSFRGNRRWWNHRLLDHYIADLKTGNAPIQSDEILTREQLGFEAFFLALRTKLGLHLKDFSEEYQQDLLATKGPMLADLSDAGYIVIQDGILLPTRSGLAIADRLALI